MLCLQSWTSHLTNYSKPLQRMLCEASAKLPVLTLFTKGAISECTKYLTSTFSSCSMRKDTEGCQYRPLFPHKLANFQMHPCPLCEEAKMMLEPYKDKFTLEEIDITLPNHSIWLEKYKYEIPVFHLNGKFLMKHQVDIQKLENHLLNLELQDERNK